MFKVVARIYTAMCGTLWVCAHQECKQAKSWRVDASIWNRADNHSWVQSLAEDITPHMLLVDIPQEQCISIYISSSDIAMPSQKWQKLHCERLSEADQSMFFMFRNVHNKTEAIAWRTSSTHKEHVLNQVVTNKQPRALSSIEAAEARRRQLCEPTSSLMHGHLWGRPLKQGDQPTDAPCTAWQTSTQLLRDHVSVLIARREADRL